MKDIIIIYNQYATGVFLKREYYMCLELHDYILVNNMTSIVELQAWGLAYCCIILISHFILGGFFLFVFKYTYFTFIIYTTNVDSMFLEHQSKILFSNSSVTNNGHSQFLFLQKVEKRLIGLALKQ